MEIYREMGDNDSTCGAFLFAFEFLGKQAKWDVQPAVEGHPTSMDAAQFLRECMQDMAAPWGEFIGEVFTDAQYGWSYFEQVYKQRVGPDETDSSRRSNYTDGRIGWRKFSIVGQNTLWEWEIEDDGGIRGLWQNDYYRLGSGPVFVPIEKALLFRTRVVKNNPEGYALDPATPVPTPDGWRTMGDLREGDKIFDENGRIRYVTATARWRDRPCFKLKFSCGDEIVADENHLWATHDFYERPSIRSTKQIAESITHSTQGHTNHSIAWNGPLDHLKQDLPLDPYFLGLWLGDGSRSGAQIACHAQDLEEEQQLLAACGYKSVAVHNGPQGSQGRQIRVYGDHRWDSTGPGAVLRALGIKNNKHIPDSFLHGSIDQRRALLAGLMDSDGTVDTYGRCEFNNTNKNLIDGVAQLVRSLGVGVAVCTRPRKAKHHALMYRVKFTPPWSPFRLKRKADRTKPVRSRNWTYIVSAERASNRETVCIETDAPSHLFLAGRSMIPTHNSLLRRAFRSWWHLKRIQEIEAIGIERDLAGLPVVHVPQHIMSPTASASDASLRAMFEQLVQQIRRDEREGIVMPAETDINGNPTGYKLSLLSTGGRRAIDTDATIRRYQRDIVTSVLHDWILLGQNAVGSFALASAKTEMSSVALNAVLDGIADVLNRIAVARLFALNPEFPREHWPKLVHGDVEAPALAEIGQYVAQLAGVGAIELDRKLERHLRRIAALPEMEQDDSPVPRLPAALQPEIESPAGVVPSAEPQPLPGTEAIDPDLALNDAQVQALVQLVSEVAQGVLPRDSALAIMTAAFPIDDAQAERILGSVGRGFTPTPEPPR